MTPTTQVYHYILTYKTDNDGNSPTIREIGRALGLRNQPALEVLRQLESQGLIVRLEGKSRGIKVVGAKWVGPEVEAG